MGGGGGGGVPTKKLLEIDLLEINKQSLKKLSRKKTLAGIRSLKKC